MTIRVRAPNHAAPTDASRDEDHVLSGGWFAFCFILGLTLFGFIDRQMLTLVAAPMARELHLSDGQLGMVLGLSFAIFSVVAVYPIAWAADRFDRRLVLACCILTWSLGTAACGTATTFPQLFLATVAIAAGETSLDTIGLSIIPDLFFGRKRAMANALYYFFAYLGRSLGLMLGGYAVTKLDTLHGSLPDVLRSWSSWRLAFFLVAMPAPVFIVCAIFARLGRPKPLPDAQAGQPSNTLPALIRRHPLAYLTVFSALSAYLFSFGGFLSWLPTIATRLFGATAAENGFGMGLASMLGMFGGVGTGILLMRRLLPRSGVTAALKIAWTVAAAGAPVLLLYGFVAATWHLYALLGLLMVAGTAIGSLVATILQDMAPARLRTRVLAIYVIVSSLLSGSAPTAVGWISAALGNGARHLLLALMIVAVPNWLLCTLLFRLSERPFARLAQAVNDIDRMNRGLRPPAPPGAMPDVATP